MAVSKIDKVTLDPLFDLDDFTNAFEEQFQTIAAQTNSPSLTKKSNTSFFRNSNLN
jgi:hypothetical protein